MADSFIPTKEADAAAWMVTFAAGLSAAPGTYFISSPDAAAIQAEVDAFVDALAVVMDPAQRTTVTVAIKDGCRTSAEQICRQFASLIKYNSGISDADKIAVGVRPVNNSRSTVNVPGTSPLLNIIAATPSAQTLRYADSLTPDKAAKPFGATQIQIFVAIGTAPVADPSAAQFYGAFTKNPVAVAFDAADDGKMATYFGRWASRRGDTGPFSLPVSMRIAA